MNNNQPKTSVTNKSGFFYGYYLVIASFMIIGAAFGVRLTYGIFFNPMSGELGWNNATTALAFSISSIVEGVFNIILGGLTDKYGPRVILTFSGIVMGIGYCLMPLVHSVWQFYLFYGVLVGIGMGGMFVPLVAMIARWFKLKRNIMTGLATTGSGVGMLFIPPLISELINIQGWRTTFFIIGISTAVIIVAAAQFLRLDPSEKNLKPLGADIDAKTGEVRAVKGLSLKEAFKTYQLWLIFGIFFVIGYYQASILIYLVPDALSTGMPALTASYLITTVGGTAIVGRLVLGALGDKMGNRLVFILCFGAYVLSLFWIIANNSAVAFFGYAALFGLAQGGTVTCQSPLVASLFGLKSHGLIFGCAGFALTVGMAVGPYLSGLTVDATHHYSAALISCAVVSLAGVVCALLIKRVKTAPHEIEKI
jgi:MFS family permease